MSRVWLLFAPVAEAPLPTPQSFAKFAELMLHNLVSNC